MRKHGSHFRSIVGKRQKPTRHVKISARQRKGIDGRRVQDGDAVGLLRIFRNRRQRAGDAGDEPFRLGVTIFAAITRHDARMLARTHLGAGIILLHFFHGLRIIRGAQGGLVGRAEERLARRQEHRRRCQHGTGGSHPARTAKA
ncbi:hypothetical protein D3C78_1502050 [compost metagenome]